MATASDYTVGWLCATTKEYVSARQVLDEIYQDNPNFLGGKGDTHIYTRGRIKQHHVVVGCLPAGNYGTVSAAEVAMSMKSSFPCIRFGLMVGIAGAAPTAKDDVRLGDVVVGTRIVPYTFGKRTQDGFNITGQADRPAEILLSAVHHMEALLYDGLDLHEIVQKTFGKSERIKAGARRPDSDRLYRSDYVHQNQGFCDCLKASNADHSLLVQRSDREDWARVTVHQGSIGSADQVLKDAHERDRIARESNILCIEMESAGLRSNKFPCLAIRGMCDYADSHKNDEWHGYAAAVAAVYAKKLLEIVPADEITEARIETNEIALKRFVAPLVDELKIAISDLSKGTYQLRQEMQYALGISRDAVEAARCRVDFLQTICQQNTSQLAALTQDSRNKDGEVETIKESLKIMQTVQGALTDSLRELRYRIDLRERLETLSEGRQKPGELEPGFMYPTHELETLSEVANVFGVNEARNSPADLNLGLQGKRKLILQRNLHNDVSVSRQAAPKMGLHSEAEAMQVFNTHVSSPHLLRRRPSRRSENGLSAKWPSSIRTTQQTKTLSPIQLLQSLQDRENEQAVRTATASHRTATTRTITLVSVLYLPATFVSVSSFFPKPPLPFPLIQSPPSLRRNTDSYNYKTYFSTDIVKYKTTDSGSISQSQFILWLEITITLLLITVAVYIYFVRIQHSHASLKSRRR